MKAYVPIKIMMIANKHTITKSKAMLNWETPIMIPLTPSTEYVMGLTNMNGDNHEGKFVIGKSAPERKNSGNMRKLLIN